MACKQAAISYLGRTIMWCVTEYWINTYARNMLRQIRINHSIYMEHFKCDQICNQDKLIWYNTDNTYYQSHIYTTRVNVTLKQRVNRDYCCYFQLAAAVPTILVSTLINPLNAELNPICYLLALFGAHHILDVGRIRVNTHILGFITD